MSKPSRVRIPPLPPRIHNPLNGVFILNYMHTDTIKAVKKMAQWPAIVFILHLIALYSGLYYAIPKLDNLLHFLGGMSIAAASFTLFAYAKHAQWMNIQRWWLQLFLIVAIVALTAVSWECMEYLLDHIVGSHMQGDITDTMSDLLLALTGALLLSIFREHSAKSGLAKIAHTS